MAESPRIAKWQEMVRADALDQLAHFMLGKEYLNEGRHMEAAAELRRCVELNPDYTAAWRYLGEAYEKAGVLKEAAAAWRTGIGVAERTGDLQAGKEMKVFLQRLPDEFSKA
jgi:Tfp pilus assembly protein PilF